MSQLIGPEAVEIDSLSAHTIPVLYSDFTPTWNMEDELQSFTLLFASVVLLILGYYFFYISQKLYSKIFSPKWNWDDIIDTTVALVPIAVIWFWIQLIIWIKDEDYIYFIDEIQYYPNQYIPPFIIGSILLLTISIFRFSQTVFLNVTNDTSESKSLQGYSLIGIVFSIIAVLADIVTIWLVF